MGKNINQNLSAAMRSINQDIQNIIQQFGKLSSYDLSKMFHLNRPEIDSSVTKQVRQLTNEINALSKEVLKTDADSAWQSIISKTDSLYRVLSQFGKTRDLAPFQESLNLLKEFQGHKIFVSDKAELLQNTGMTVRELNNQFRNLGVTFTTVAKNSINLDSIWQELFRFNPQVQQISNFGDQVSYIVKELQVAKEALQGDKNLYSNPQQASSVILDYMNKIEQAINKIRILKSQQQDLLTGQASNAKDSVTDTTDTIVQNETRKQEAYQQTEKIRQQTAEQIAQANSFVDREKWSGGFYTQQVLQQIEAYNRLGIELPQVKARIEELKAAETTFNQVMNDSNATIEQQRTAYENFQTALKTAKESNSIANNMYLTQNAVDNLILKFQQLLQSNTKLTSTTQAEINQWIAKLQETGGVYKSTGNDAVAALKRIKAEQQKVSKSSSSFASFLKKIPMVSYWTSTTYIMMRAIRAVKSMLSNVHELDNALTNISYTMDISNHQLKQIGESSLQMAQDLHTSASNVLSSVKLYANAKESADSILQKSQPAIMISNVTGMTGEESAKMLQSIMNQFDMTQDDLMEIADTIEMVSQNMAYDFASGIDEIAKGIEQSGSVAKSAGLNLQEYVSMLGLVIEKTGQSGSTIGNAYKTIFQRITKASATEGTLEEDISAAEKSLRAVGIEVRDTSDEFRDLSEILSDLGKVWNTLSSVQQSNISYNVAGIRQTNILKSLLGYWGDYESLVEKANDSSGTTFKNQEIYAESLTGKIGELKAVWETIGDNTVESSFLKTMVTIGTGVSSLIEKFGLLKSVIAGVGITAFFKNFA